MANSKHIVNWFFEQVFDSALIDFDDHVVSAVQECFNKDPIDAEFYVSGNRNTIWESLRRRIAEDKKRGIYPTFDVALDGVYRLIWFPNFYSTRGKKQG